MTTGNSASLPASPFTLIETAEQIAPFVLNSPHSGREYSREFLESSRLNAHSIRSSEDFQVDELVGGATALGIPLLAANFPRAFLDVNREPFELDQTMFDGELPAFTNTRSVRVSSGLGTIAKIVAEGEEIYIGKLSVQDGLDRVEQYYKPYHNMLRSLVARTHVKFGCAVLLDFHSMPSANPAHNTDFRPDIILGDRFGSSCAHELVHRIRLSFQNLGYRVELNKPYAGGFITGHYGRPENGLHALQIELNRGLYMNEATLKPNRMFENVRNDITTVMADVINMDLKPLGDYVPLGAE